MPIATCILLLISSVSANSGGNVTDTVGWVSDPSGRGTFTLVSSCILTLGLCVWSAMHLNIPPHNERPITTLRRNIKWSLTGIVAPELVVFAAWRQYNSAKTLTRQVQKHLDAQPKDSIIDGVETSEGSSQGKNSEDSGQQQRWSMVHSFYAGMGGFFMDREVLPGDEGSVERLTLTARGVALLAECGHLPRIYKDDIEDKNKADSLAKSLVCIQAAWMVVQVCARVAAGLPVTLLEVNTLGHVLCALVIYILWWNKPRLVREATKVEGDWVASLCSYMHMSSQISGHRSQRTGLLLKQHFDPELNSLALFVPQIDMGPTSSVSAVEQNPVANGKGSGISIRRGSVSNVSTHSVDKRGQPFDGDMNCAYFGSRPAILTDSSDGSVMTEKAGLPLVRWHQAAEAVRAYSAVRRRFTLIDKSGTPQDDLIWLKPDTEELVTKIARNWPSDDLLRGTAGLVIGMVLWFASMAYGGIHLAAWNAFFPSEAETWMWRVAALHVTASGFLWLNINLLAQLSKPLDAYWDRVVALQASRLSYLIIGFLCTICGFAYIVARIFLVVEAFISIRELPAPAYVTPDWTQVIPHF